MFKNKFVAVAAAASISVLGAGAPMLALSPSAHAQDAAGTSQTTRAVTGGTMSWGVKESFRKYLNGVIGNGYTEFNGQKVSGTNPLTFNVKKSTMSSKNSGVIEFDGTVHFYGHGGKLDTTMSNIRLLVDGDRAQVVADAKGRKFVNMFAEGPAASWTDARLANIQLNGQVDFTADTVKIQGNTKLSTDPQAAEIFAGNYKAGTELDPIDVKLRLEDTNGSAPTLPLDINVGWAGGAASGSNSNGGPAGIVGTINDTIREVNNLFVNSDNLLNNADKLFNRNSNNTSNNQDFPSIQAPAPTGTDSTPPNAPANPTDSANPANPAPNNGGLPVNPETSGVVGGTNVSAAAAQSNGQTAKPQSSGAGSGSVCTDNGSRGVQKASAAWGVRQSFRTYLKGAIAKGGWELSGVGDANGAFQWNGTAGAVNMNNKSGSVLFPGAIRFFGHDGVLDTRLSNMEIQFSGNSGQLILNAKSNNADGKSIDYGRVTIANLSLTKLDITDSSVTGQANATLTAAGAEAFGQFYPAGSPLDPIAFTAQLAGSPNCANGQGTQNSGAATGQGSTPEQAAALRGGGGSVSSVGSVTEGSPDGDSASVADGGSVFDDAAGGGSVFDEVEGVDSTSTSKGNGESQFQIKAAGEDSITWDDSTVAQMLVILASFITSGGVLTRFILKN